MYFGKIGRFWVFEDIVVGLKGKCIVFVDFVESFYFFCRESYPQNPSWVSEGSWEGSGRCEADVILKTLRHAINR